MSKVSRSERDRKELKSLLSRLRNIKNKTEADVILIRDLQEKYDKLYLTKPLNKDK